MTRDDRAPPLPPQNAIASASTHSSQQYQTKSDPQDSHDVVAILQLFREGSVATPIRESHRSPVATPYHDTDLSIESLTVSTPASLKLWTTDAL